MMMARLQADELYKERINNVMAIFVLVNLLIIFLLIVVAVIISAFRGNSDVDGFLILLLLFGLGVSYLAFNFIRLDTIITPSGIKVSYKCFRHTISWDNIQSYAVKPYSLHLGFDLLWGLSIGFNNRKPVLYYRTYYPLDPIILLEHKRGFFKYFGFSTSYPEKITALINKWKK